MGLSCLRFCIRCSVYRTRALVCDTLGRPPRHRWLLANPQPSPRNRRDERTGADRRRSDPRTKSPPSVAYSAHYQSIRIDRRRAVPEWIAERSFLSLWTYFALLRDLSSQWGSLHSRLPPQTSAAFRLVESQPQELWCGRVTPSSTGLNASIGFGELCMPAPIVSGSRTSPIRHVTCRARQYLPLSTCECAVRTHKKSAREAAAGARGSRMPRAITSLRRNGHENLPYHHHCRRCFDACRVLRIDVTGCTGIAQ